jgi:hypothetical protein
MNAAVGAVVRGDGITVAATRYGVAVRALRRAVRAVGLAPKPRGRPVKGQEAGAVLAAERGLR